MTDEPDPDDERGGRDEPGDPAPSDDHPDDAPGATGDPAPVDPPAGPLPEDEALEVHDGAEPPLPPGEVDRVFGVMEEAVDSDALGERQLDRLFTVLEGLLSGSSETNPETLAELLSLLEDLVVDPDDLENVDGLLSVLEEAVAGATPADADHIEDVFDVIEEGIADPTALGPEDVERFRSGIESALVDMTDPAGGIGQLFPVPGLSGDDPDVPDEGDGATDMVRIARVAAGMTQRATGYSLESGIRTGTRMAYAAANAESPAKLLTEARAITLDELQRAGIDLGDEQTDWLEAHEEELVDSRPVTRETLLKRGERLLSQSAEIGRDESLHPAFGSVIEELSGDEARILRLLATDGTQASMDVRDKRYVPFRSRLVAANLTMLGSDAGCREPERTPVYLGNLERLGLITFSDDPIEDLKHYQVLEAQPHIETARDAAKRPKTVYGSVHLTDFGVEFCRTCLPFEVTAEPRGTRFRRAAQRKKERERNGE